MNTENTEKTPISSTPYSGNLLRNFTASYLDETISKFWGNPKEYHALKRKTFESNSFLTIEKIMKDKLKHGFDDSKLDEILFNELTYILPDNHFIYSFDTQVTQQGIVKRINDKTNTLNKKIYNSNLNKEELQLVSIREENDKLVLLFRNGYTKNEDEKKTVFFIACEFNFTQKTFIIKLRETLRKNSKILRRTVIQDIFDYLKVLLIDVSITGKTEKTIKENIYDLFSKESSSAEALITAKLPITEKILDKNISEFITKNLNLTEPSSLDSNCKIIKAMYYQNVAKTIDSKTFSNRYIFAFSFFDGSTTKSITRDSKRNHIYGKDLYWSLRGVVHKETKVDELSIYYKINRINYKIAPVGNNFIPFEVTLREFYGSFMVDFYNTNRRDPERRIKSEFIIFELGKYL